MEYKIKYCGDFRLWADIETNEMPADTITEARDKIKAMMDLPINRHKIFEVCIMGDHYIGNAHPDRKSHLGQPLPSNN